MSYWKGTMVERSESDQINSDLQVEHIYPSFPLLKYLECLYKFFQCEERAFLLNDHVPNHEFSYILRVLIDVKKVSKESISFHLFTLSGLPWWFRWWRIHMQCRRPRFDPWVEKISWESPMGRGAWLATVHGEERVRHIWMTNIFLWVMWAANHFTLLGFGFFICKLQDITYWILNFILPSCIILWFLILWKFLWLSTGILILIQLSVYSANTTNTCDVQELH